MYPLNLLPHGLTVQPIFGQQLKGDPYIFNFSISNPRINEYQTTNFTNFQQQIEQELSDAGASWGIGCYLENRQVLLRNYPQMVEEERVFHLGLDVTAPAGTSLHAPLAATIYKTGFDAGVGNYGGYCILQHDANKTTFYSFYGHLNPDTILLEGTTLAAGIEFAQIGNKEHSGGWFTHLHLQILTQKAINQGLIDIGYIAQKDLAKVQELFPSPYHLFRY